MSTPHVCPKCHGENSTDCQPCKGTGIVWEGAPTITITAPASIPITGSGYCQCGRCKECGRHWMEPWIYPQPLVIPTPIWVDPTYVPTAPTWTIETGTPALPLTSTTVTYKAGD